VVATAERTELLPPFFYFDLEPFFGIVFEEYIDLSS
jgi:hypothetical protein